MTTPTLTTHGLPFRAIGHGGSVLERISRRVSATRRRLRTATEAARAYESAQTDAARRDVLARFHTHPSR